MRQLLFKSIAALLAGMLVSCSPSEPSGYHGSLYYGKGPYLMRLSLHDGSLSVVDNLGDKTIRELSEFGPDNLLIAETASVNRKAVARISWFNLKTGQTSAMYSGVVARYLPEAGVVVYDDGSKLFAVPQFGDEGNEEIFSHRSGQLDDLVEAGGDTLLFETGQTGEYVIHAWNAETSELRQLDSLAAVCRLGGAVWIGSLRRLACKALDGADSGTAYVLVGLDGVVDRALNLPEGRQFRALAYIGDQDAVIFKETWYGFFGKKKRSGVWVHNVQTGENIRLSKNENLGGSVVYSDH